MDSIKQLEEVMPRLSPQDLRDILIDKFEIEKMDRFFKRVDYSFPGRVLKLDPSTAILLEFETLQKDFPEDYRDFLSYKLLLILNFSGDIQPSAALDLQNDLIAIANNDSVNKIVIWSQAKTDLRMITVLKRNRTDILHLDLQEVKNTRFISNFFPHPSNDYDYAVVLNKVAELLLKRLKKLFHLVLSEIAAPIYNRRYGKTKIATQSVMEYEEVVLNGLMQRLKRSGHDHLAVDVGCGTGRHSFMLGKFFQQVHGFDISPKMIKEADREKRGMTPQPRIVFSVSDFEYEELLDEDKFQGRVDIVVASFGMGSFIEDTLKMLKRCHDWLVPGGYLFLSFYNSQSIVLQMTPNWRDTSLSAHLDIDNNTLRVELTPDIIFQIYCKPFTNEVKSEIQGLFNIEKVYTYPTVMALLPNNLLETQLGRELFSFVDRELNRNEQYNNLGHYTMIVAQKPRVSLTGHSAIMEILRAGDCVYEIIEHQPVFSIKDVLKIMNLPRQAIFKTVVFTYKRGKVKKLVSVSIRADKRVNKKKLAEVLETNPNPLRFASEKQITSLGFPVGGIAPFGFREDSHIRKLVDKDVAAVEAEWFYMGIGDNKKTLKIKRECFLSIIKDYEQVDVADDGDA
jgi:prolyl-tRNA editing enzyme YbaK/EbsC (Cys-tRNA(Pro) deacylase)/SAM-dependent methyltransferase